MLIKFLRINCLISGLSSPIAKIDGQLGIGAMLDSCADFFYPMFLRTHVTTDTPTMGFVDKQGPSGETMNELLIIFFCHIFCQNGE